MLSGPKAICLAEHLVAGVQEQFKIKFKVYLGRGYLELNLTNFFSIFFNDQVSNGSVYLSLSKALPTLTTILGEV